MSSRAPAPGQTRRSPGGTIWHVEQRCWVSGAECLWCRVVTPAGEVPVPVAVRVERLAEVAPLVDNDNPDELLGEE